MTSPLATLERIKADYGPGLSQKKLALLRVLGHATLATFGQVARLHEAVLFLRAYPDDVRVMDAAERVLRGFGRRADVARHAEALGSSGIAGTPTDYAFFHPTVQWLAACWPDALTLDRADGAVAERISALLPRLAGALPAAWLTACSPDGFEALDRLRGHTTDAAWLLQSFKRLSGDSFTHEALHDAAEIRYRLSASRGTPNRSTARAARMPIAFRAGPIDRARPDLAKAVAQPPKQVRRAGPAEGEALIALARGAMVARARDLDAFAYGNRDDVIVVDDGDGLTFTFNGMRPERRTLFAAIYGYLIMSNGVPIGYGQFDLLGPSAAVSFNLFPTFRGVNAAHTFARLLAATRAIFGATTFTFEPYQLGDGNDEAIDSGAWWFYYKLGFRPAHGSDRNAAAVSRVMRAEHTRMQRDPRHRSSRRTLEALARSHVIWHAELARAVGLPRLAALGAAAVDALAKLEGDAALAAMRRIGLRSLDGWRVTEREALARWSPIVLALPSLGRWSASDRRALVAVIRAKGARHETDFLVAVARHKPLVAVLFG